MGGSSLISLGKVGKGALETGYLGTLMGAEALGMSLTGFLGGVGLPLLGAGSVLYTEGKKNKKSKEIIKEPKEFSYSLSEGMWINKSQLKELNEQKKKLELDNDITIGPATGKERTVPGISNQSIPGKIQVKDQTKAAIDLMNSNLIGELLKMNKLQEKIDNTVNMENKINVDPPKVDVNTRVYIDGKNIPTQRVEFDYRQVEKQTEVQSRRYGNPNVMKY